MFCLFDFLCDLMCYQRRISIISENDMKTLLPFPVTYLCDTEFFSSTKKKKIAPQIEYHSSLKNPADFIVRHQRTVHKSKTMPLFSPIFASENTFF